MFDSEVDLISKMRQKELTHNQQNALNIAGSIVVVAINTLINFLLSPFIVAHLGVAANGYIMLANNFVSYILLVKIALNSMSGRFLLIEIYRGNTKEANEYYSSVLFGDWILAGLLLIPSIILIGRLEHFINVDIHLLGDIRLLFAIVFMNFFIDLFAPQWTNATYSTNKLHLRSLRNAVSVIARALCIYIAFRYFSPHTYYVAIAGTVMTFVGLSLDYYFKVSLLPQLKIRFSYFRFRKVKELISSGIWNSISQSGNLLLEGLDLLIANIFINPVASGVLALSKIIPNMINQITGNIVSTFGPSLTYLYADGKYNEMATKIKSDIKLLSLIASLPIGITFSLGAMFFKLWIPSQDANMLTLLSSLTLIGMLISGIANCIVNVFGVVNKLKLNALIVIISGLINILAVYILLKFTDLGIIAIAGVSSIVSIIRVFAFTLPYAAICIKGKWYLFIIPLLRGALNVLIPTLIGFAAKYFVDFLPSWPNLIICLLVTTVLTCLINYFIFLNKSQRAAILKLLYLN